MNDGPTAAWKGLFERRPRRVRVGAPRGKKVNTEGKE